MILTRRSREKIIITLEDGRFIEVGVEQVRRGKVRLSFTADKSIAIYRKELQDEIDANVSSSRAP